MRLEGFTESHIAGASGIAAARAARLRAQVPFVPEAWTAAATWAEVADWVARDGIGFAALEGERVVGVLAGWPVRVGEHRVYCPEGTAGISPELAPRTARRVGEALIEAASAAWVSVGLRTHVVSVLPSDAAFHDLLGWLGFGAVVVDALAPIEALTGAWAGSAAPASLGIRRAGPDDLPSVVALEGGLRAHLASSPAFLVVPHPIDPAEHAAALADPAVATFLAESAGGEPVGFVRIGPSADDVAQVVRAPDTASISRAFTMAARRGEGVGAALLGAAATWARGAGYIRVGVDFESANILASRFWTARLVPVALSLARRLNPLAGTPEANP